MFILRREWLTHEIMLTFVLISSVVLSPISCIELFEADAYIPAVVTTWKFSNATERAWDILYNGRGTAIDAVEAGCAVCEYEQCDFTVGYGGSPDENGETTLDAMIMDGTTMNVGAVGGLRRIKNAVGVARKVLDNTKHTLLVGSLATEFAVEMGFHEENLTTPFSLEMYEKWKRNNCQPNFRTNVKPDSTKHCGPYKPVDDSSCSDRKKLQFGEDNHDTIGMLAVDSNHRVASGTSTNGARHKVPGRVGDSPVPGAGSYADGSVGAAAATGDGDVMMRFLPSFLAVEEMTRGKSPEKAAQIAVRRIAHKYPDFRGAVIALRKDGMIGAACSGMDAFPYCVANPLTGTVKILSVKCA